MSTVLYVATFWVFAGTIVAMLPMKRQFYLGVPLFFGAPVVIVWLAVEYGLWVFILALLAFLSMFRYPLRYFLRRGLERLRGKGPEA